MDSKQKSGGSLWPWLAALLFIGLCGSVYFLLEARAETEWLRKDFATQRQHLLADAAAVEAGHQETVSALEADLARANARIGSLEEDSRNALPERLVSHYQTLYDGIDRMRQGLDGARGDLDAFTTTLKEAVRGGGEDGVDVP